MGIALGKLAEEDPTFRVRTDPESSQTIISGMGELHLDIIVDRLKREFHVDCTVGNPQVAYRETIRKAVKSEGKFVRQSGGKGQYGHCWLELTPLKPGEGFKFENKIVGGAIPKEYIAPVQAGVEEAMENGVVAGYPMVDIGVTVYDGSYHEVDSSEMAFKIAGSMGFKSGAAKADPVLLEPYMKVEVTVPEEYMGDVIGDLNPAVAASKAWKQEAVPKSFPLSFPCLKCSGMQRTFVPRPRAVATTPWKSTITKKFLRTSRKRLLPKIRERLNKPQF